MTLDELDKKGFVWKYFSDSLIHLLKTTSFPKQMIDLYMKNIC